MSVLPKPTIYHSLGKQMTEYDSPWKDALDRYFGWFMALCFPELDAQIDWSVPAKMLDKELQRIAPQSESGVRRVDKLVEVRLLTGEIEWLLIHLEVQSQQTSGFSERMFVYFYRIRDKYKRPVVSLAVLGDDNDKWRPSRFEQDLFGCKATFEYPTVKLLDFLDRVDELELLENPFATVILGHLMAMQTAGEPLKRCDWKIRLLRPLYERGMLKEDVRELFRVIDWMLDLPDAIAIQFDNELRKIEQEYQMPYVTSIERRAIEQGASLGRIAGQIQLLQQLAGEPVENFDELLKLPIEQLESKFEQLQQSLANRKQSP